MMKSKNALAASLSLLICLGPGGLAGTVAFALPQGYESVAGNVQFSQPDAKTLNVTSGSNKSIVNYQNFNVWQNETVNFMLPSSRAAILNRVLGGDPSQIFGRINSNGKVFLINPSGILFGRTAQVNVGSLFASTMNISNQDFLNGNLSFQNDGAGAVVNQGTINIDKGGYAILAGSAVENTGTIAAPLGQVHLAVGGQLTMNVDDGVLVGVTVDEALVQSAQDYLDAVRNTGTIEADGGLVKLQAKLQTDMYQRAVNNEGRVQAQSVAFKNGVVEFNAEGGNAVVQNTGTVDVSGMGENETGGTANILGDVVLLGGDALIQASGANGGGNIHVGGDYQGKGPLHTASETYVGRDVQLLANAETQGDGGNVIVWSDGHTRFEGTAEAKGGAFSGNGGLVETSGKQTLFVDRTARIDASAANGKGGLWLLDPTNLTVSVGAGADSASQVYADNIQTTLNTGTNVTLQTDAGGAEAGKVTVQDGVTIAKTAGADATLRMNAHESIIFNGSATGISVGSTHNKLNVILNANADNDASGGAIALTGTTINSNGGDITLGGGLDPLNTAAKGTSNNRTGILLSDSSLDAGAGNISLAGAGWDNAGASALYGIRVENGSQLSTTTGNITVTGTGGAGTYSNYGVYLYGADSRIESADGNVTITAQGGGNGTDKNNYGLYLSDGGQIVSTGAATLDITGTGGAGTSENYGVYLYDSDSRIESANGNVTITGTGGVGTDSNHGLYLTSGGQIVSTGTAKLDITGTGGDGGSYSIGINLGGTDSRIESANGNVSVTGTGGAGTDSNHGLLLSYGGQIVSTGTAKLDITGIGGAGTSDNYGVYLEGADSLIESANGNVSVTGTGGAGSGTNNLGLYLYNGGQIVSTGTAKLDITGIGGDGGSYSNGVYLEGNNSRIESANGNVSVTGTGGDGSTYNHGLLLSNGGQIVSTGTAKLDITGTGGAGTSSNFGVYLNGSNTRIESVDGNVSVTGTGGDGSGNNNHGLYFYSGAQIVSTNSANLTVTGIKGGGTSQAMNAVSGSNIIGSNTMTGDIILIADAFSISHLQLRTAGDLTFRPYSNAASIGINGGAGTLQITNSILGRIDDSVVSPSRIIIGNALTGTGLVTIADGWDLSGLTSPVSVYGGSLTAGGINTGANSLLLAARTGDAVLNGVIDSAATGDAVTIAVSNGNFINNAGAGLFNLTGGGRWLVYSSSPSKIQAGALSGYSEAYSTSFGDNISAFSGNHIFYAENASLTSASQSGVTSPTVIGSTMAEFVRMPMVKAFLGASGTPLQSRPLALVEDRRPNMPEPEVDPSPSELKP